MFVSVGECVQGQGGVMSLAQHARPLSWISFQEQAKFADRPLDDAGLGLHENTPDEPFGPRQGLHHSA